MTGVRAYPDRGAAGHQGVMGDIPDGAATAAGDRLSGMTARAEVDRKLLSYTSAPLRRATRVTGLGKVTLTVTGVRGARHGALYAYLEDVQPDGHVTYITEGELDLTDRATLPKRDNPPWRSLRTPAATQARTPRRSPSASRSG